MVLRVLNLAERLESMYGIDSTSVERINKGFTNEIYLIRSSSKNYIARLSNENRRGHLLLETEILEEISQHINQFMVPKTISNHYSERLSDFNGRLLTLFEYIPGSCASDSWDKRNEISYDFGKAVGELHRVFDDLNVNMGEYSMHNLVHGYRSSFEKYKRNYSGKEWEKLFIENYEMITKETKNVESRISVEKIL